MTTHGRLITHFVSGYQSRDKQSEGWSSLWESNENDLWDRGQPSKALIDFIESKPEAIPKLKNEHSRPKALVPGCGKGYDVAMLALHGFDVYGLEVSEKGCQVARDYAASELANPRDINFKSREEWASVAHGSVKIISGDFFKRSWEEDLEKDGVTGFDLVYDYTFLCALLPEMRIDWARRMSELVSPTGVLVCLEFPMYKSLTEQGPPWGLNGVHWNLLAQGGNGEITQKGEEVESPEGKFKRIIYFSPPRSYENGKGEDMLSVWKLKAQ